MFGSHSRIFLIFWVLSTASCSLIVNPDTEDRDPLFTIPEIQSGTGGSAKESTTEDVTPNGQDKNKRDKSEVLEGDAGGSVDGTDGAGESSSSISAKDSSDSSISVGYDGSNRDAGSIDLSSGGTDGVNSGNGLGSGGNSGAGGIRGASGVGGDRGPGGVGGNVVGNGGQGDSGSSGLAGTGGAGGNMAEGGSGGSGGPTSGQGGSLDQGGSGGDSGAGGAVGFGGDGGTVGACVTLRECCKTLTFPAEMALCSVLANLGNEMNCENNLETYCD